MERWKRGYIETTAKQRLRNKQRSRLERWNAKHVSSVTHPDHGTVVVPYCSNFTAILNAAEIWGCDWTTITTAAVKWVDQSTIPEKMPIHYI